MKNTKRVKLLGILEEMILKAIKKTQHSKESYGMKLKELLDEVDPDIVAAHSACYIIIGRLNKKKLILKKKFTKKEQENFSNPGSGRIPAYYYLLSDSGHEALDKVEKIRQTLI